MRPSDLYELFEAAKPLYGTRPIIDPFSTQCLENLLKITHDLQGSSLVADWAKYLTDLKAFYEDQRLPKPLARPGQDRYREVSRFQNAVAQVVMDS